MYRVSEVFFFISTMFFCFCFYQSKVIDIFVRSTPHFWLICTYATYWTLINKFTSPRDLIGYKFFLHFIYVKFPPLSINVSNFSVKLDFKSYSPKYRNVTPVLFNNCYSGTFYHIQGVFEIHQHIKICEYTRLPKIQKKYLFREMPKNNQENKFWKFQANTALWICFKTRRTKWRIPIYTIKVTRKFH